MDYLSKLENQSIYILREAFNKFDHLAMLWSIGKDSTVLLWLARKAFFGHVPFPLVHVDTTYKIPSMIEYRDKLVRDWKLQLIVGKNEEVLKSGVTFPDGKATRVECCGTLKKDALQQVLHHHGFTGVIVGVRRDEEPTRAKERYFSPRDRNMEWNVEDQPPELWDQFKTDFEKGTHIRIHPLLHWTELKIVIVGHVDHGKSTFVGRLLHDTGSLPEGKLEQLREVADRRGIPFEWANLMDSLQAERDQNITIDTSQIWFQTPKRQYVIID